MKPNCCPKPGTRGILSILLPGAAWLAIPKCPVCLAGYLALFTGIGFSVGFASGLRFAIIFLFFTALFLFAVRLFRNYTKTKS